ncbi:putative O-glycosylation ligase, exosortase A system-associated [Photobacterium sp. R1]
MRDLVFLSVFMILACLSLRRPYMAVSLWLWSGLFVPSYWVYSFAKPISYNTAFALITFLTYLFSRRKPVILMDGVVVFTCLFWILTGLTTYNTIIIPELVWLEWEKFSKVFLMFMMIALIIRQRHEFEMLLWGLIMSVGFMGAIEGLKFIASMGGHKIQGPTGHLLTDNNHFATALCMIIPLIVYQLKSVEEKWIRAGLVGVLGLCILAILGTYSRGGFLALAIIGCYFWIKSKRKALTLLAVGVVACLSVLILPQQWYDRMETIETAATNDTSFINRVNSWKVHTLMAMDRPFLGGGFKAAYFPTVWERLSVDVDKVNFIETPPPGEQSRAAHSIYFQVLGDHGFVGLALFLLIILLSFLKMRWVIVTLSQPPWNEQYRWQVDLARMMQVSLLAFCVAGAALSLAYLELFWALAAAMAGLSMQVKVMVLRDYSRRNTAEVQGYSSRA